MAHDEVWDELRALWGPDRLRPIAPDRVADASVTDSTKAFLTEVGLPFEAPLLVTFFHDDRLLQPVEFSEGQYLLIGDDTGTLLGLRSGSSEVWSIGGSLDRPMFVNTDVWSFALLLGLYEHRVPDLAGRIAAHDAPALADAGHWWSLIAEQMRHGFL